MGKSGGCINSYSEAIGRLVSLSLRAGVKIESIIDQMRGVRCPVPHGIGKNAVLSCADGIGRVLEHYIGKEPGNGNGGIASAMAPDPTPLATAAMQAANPTSKADSIDMGVCPECPECGNMIEFIEGCLTCRGCGYSKC